MCFCSSFAEVSITALYLFRQHFSLKWNTLTKSSILIMHDLMDQWNTLPYISRYTSCLHISLYTTQATFPHIIRLPTLCYHSPWQHVPIYISHLMLTHIGNVYPHISPTLCYHTLWQCLPIYITHLMLPHTPAMFSHVYITHLMLPHTRATFSHIYHPLYVTAPFGNIFPYIYHPPYVTTH